MYSMFVDESGIGDTYTILAGVIIHSKEYNSFSEGINNILIKVFGTNKIILKEIRRKNYDSQISEIQSNNFNLEYYSFLTQIKPVFIISAIQNSWGGNKEERLQKAYEHLLERFHKFLEKKNEFGQVIYDKSEGCFKIILQEHERLIKVGSGWGWQFKLVTHLYEDDDKRCKALQVADMLGKAFHSFLHYKNKIHAARCKPFLDKSPGNEIIGYGLKVYPDDPTIKSLINS